MVRLSNFLFDFCSHGAFHVYAWKTKQQSFWKTSREREKKKNIVYSQGRKEEWFKHWIGLWTRNSDGSMKTSCRAHEIVCASSIGYIYIRRRQGGGNTKKPRVATIEPYKSPVETFLSSCSSETTVHSLASFFLFITQYLQSYFWLDPKRSGETHTRSHIKPFFFFFSFSLPFFKEGEMWDARQKLNISMLLFLVWPSHVVQFLAQQNSYQLLLHCVYTQHSTQTRKEYGVYTRMMDGVRIKLTI